MKRPWVHMSSPSRSRLPPPSPPAPSRSSQSTRSERLSHASDLDWRSISHDNIHVSMSFSQIIPPLPSPTESKRLFYTSVSLLLSRIQGYHYHLSKFHIYALVYCIGIFLSGFISLCTIHSSFIHLIGTDSNVLLLMAE